MSTPWMSQAAAYGSTAAAVSGVSGCPGRARAARRLDDHDRVVGIDRPQVLVDRDAPGGGDMPVRRLVDALPGAEPGMRLERADDPVEQRLLRQVAVDSGERQPELEPVRRLPRRAPAPTAISCSATPVAVQTV